MPLEKSTSSEAFKKNVETEMNAGKSQAQSVAIAYAEKREAASHNHAEDLREKYK